MKCINKKNYIYQFAFLLRSTIGKVGYFTNKNFYSKEDYAYQNSPGYLCQIDVAQKKYDLFNMIKHAIDLRLIKMFSSITIYKDQARLFS